MLKKNKKKIILSSVTILLPVLFGLAVWNALPETMATHWGANGSADGFAAKAFTVFGLPVLILAVHLLGLYVTSLDQKQKRQNKKALNMIFWIAPMISLFANGMVYAVALGRTFDAMTLIPTLLGVMFVWIGNYLPKIRQNRTLGIKILWTLQNEENWNKTHRLGGKVWVLGGLAMLVSVFLPGTAMIPVTVCAILAAIVIPTVYSFCIYKKHQKNGIAYGGAAGSREEKKAFQITMIVTAIVLIGTAVLLFTGDIRVSCKDTSLKIDADYWKDLEIDYAEIDAVTYREAFDRGVRTNGYGSFKLLMGAFENEELGAYTLYAYTGAEEYVVLESGGKTLVIGMEDADETRELYQEILDRR